MAFASLCFLSYDRPEFLYAAIDSATRNAGYPCEVLVHDDGSDSGDVADRIVSMVRTHQISHAIINPRGHNEGVGTSVNRMFKIAAGDPIIKIDQDLLFEPNWLLKTVRWLDDDRLIGMFGLFRYNYRPVKWEEMNHRPGRASDDYEYVDDFVGSALVVPRRIWDEFGPFDEHSDAFAEDIAYKKNLQAHGYELALPVEDLAVNRGFGPGPSTVVYRDESGAVQVSKIHHAPLILGVPK